MAKITFLTICLAGLGYLVFLDWGAGDFRTLSNLFGATDELSAATFAPPEPVVRDEPPGPVTAFFQWVGDLPALLVLTVVFLIFAMTPPQNFSFSYFEISVRGGSDGGGD